MADRGHRTPARLRMLGSVLLGAVALLLAAEVHARPRTCRDQRRPALFRDTVETFARRHRLSVPTFVALNELGDLAADARLPHRRRYLVSRGDVGERLVGGAPLGPTTRDYVVVTPARSWGQPFVVQLLQQAAAKVQARYPRGHRLVVEDLSFEHGGCMPPHREHRGGLEADVGLYHRGVGDLRRLRRATAANFDAKRTWLFLRTLLDSGQVHRVLLDRKIIRWLRAEAGRQGATAAQIGRWFGGRRGRGGVFSRAAGHDNHAHVKFRCPKGQCAEPPDLLPEPGPGPEPEPGPEPGPEPEPEPGPRPGPEPEPEPEPEPGPGPEPEPEPEPEPGPGPEPEPGPAREPGPKPGP